ncbi:MAG: nitroreductase [Chloroflexota bacterium]
MEVKEAVLRRRSIRAYETRPVPPETIRDILETALWSPSATNAQAWHVAVVSGKAREELGRALVEASLLDHEGHREIPMPPFPDAYHERRRAVGYKVYDAKGISREDKKRRIWWYQEMLRFFSAPTALIIHTPWALVPYILQDMGMFAMSIMLLATERGLGTCPMNAPTAYPEVIKGYLGIPEDHLIALAISLGYPDMRDPVNSFPRDREPLSAVARWFE